eukprot:Selendium_serpulae@DN5999_c1_g2_i2.p1
MCRGKSTHRGAVWRGSSGILTPQTVRGSLRRLRMALCDFLTRERKKAAMTIKAHETEVNEVTWNPAQESLLLSGADDGVIKVWDTRMMEDGASGTSEGMSLVHLKWHKKPITSARWHPTDEAVFAVASADDSISIWDLSVEPDEEEESLRRKAVAPNSDDTPGIVHFPSQLMFHHLGQSEIKELQWHANIPGVIVSTALEGFNIFKPCNV